MKKAFKKLVSQKVKAERDALQTSATSLTDATLGAGGTANIGEQIGSGTRGGNLRADEEQRPAPVANSAAPGWVPAGVYRVCTLI